MGDDVAATVGVILAGGLARRMGGGDKPLRELGGRTVLSRIVARMAPQVPALILNANGDPARFAPYGLAVVADSLPGNPGPLAGVLAAMEWAEVHAPGACWIASVPGDAPFLPADFVARLHAGRGDALYVSAASGGRIHPVAALWPIHARNALRQALAGGHRKVGGFAPSGETASVEWSTDPLDPFLNLNTPEDVAGAARLLALD